MVSGKQERPLGKSGKGLALSAGRLQDNKRGLGD